MIDGFSPTLVVSHVGDSPLNATVVNLAEPDGYGFPINDTDYIQVYLLSEADLYELDIDGYVVSDNPVTVNATLFHYRHMDPEQFTYYPYRFFGLGMAAVGAVSTAVAYYLNKRGEA